MTDNKLKKLTQRIREITTIGGLKSEKKHLQLKGNHGINRQQIIILRNEVNRQIANIRINKAKAHINILALEILKKNNPKALANAYKQGSLRK